MPRLLGPLLVAAVLALAPAAASAARVLVVGDSLEVGTGPWLQRELAGDSVRVDAETGRPSGTGVRVLGERIESSDDVVVFDLGTNDDPAQPGQLSGNLEAAARLAGERCMVVATINLPPLNGVPDTGLNEAVERFAASRPNTELADWRSVAKNQPRLMQPDRVHATPQGYRVRAGVVADAVNACLGRRGDDKVTRDDADGTRTESIKFGDGLEGELLLPRGRPPHRAVLMLPGSGDPTREELRPEAEYLSRRGFATLLVDKRKGDPGYAQLTKDARAGISAVKRRAGIRSVAIWGFGEGGLIAARAAAGNKDVQAVVAVSPPGLPELSRHEWAIRSALDADRGTHAVTEMFRLAASAHEGDLTDDPKDAWRGVAQPLLILWGGRDTTLPAPESAAAILDALPTPAEFIVEPTAGHRVNTESALEAAARFLERPRTGAATPPLPPRSSDEKPQQVTEETALARTPVQLAWLATPLVLLLIAAVKGARRTLLVVLPAAAALLAIGVSLAGILNAEGENVTKLAGMPAGLALAALLAAAGVVLTIRFARTAPLVATASALWLALAAYWLI